MAKKLLFREWTERLDAIMREAEDGTPDYDRAIASNYWREGYSPREFYKEILNADEADRRENFDIRYEL
jgi:hypothetical protein